MATLCKLSLAALMIAEADYVSSQQALIFQGNISGGGGGGGELLQVAPAWSEEAEGTLSGKAVVSK